jgi:hypothetical protein
MEFFYLNRFVSSNKILELSYLVSMLVIMYANIKIELLKMRFFTDSYKTGLDYIRLKPSSKFSISNFSFGNLHFVSTKSTWENKKRLFFIWFNKVQYCKRKT